MAGLPCLKPVVLVPPLALSEMESTDTVPVEDALVAGAVELLRAGLGRPINIKTIADALNTPRRTLDRRFHRAMGMSLLDFLVRERSELAGTLLQILPPLPLGEIARRCGYSDARTMKRALRRHGAIKDFGRRPGRPAKRTKS